MNLLDNFMTNARGLAKNPLGIIALFISLIYGFACIVLSYSGSSLAHDEKMPLIWFLILFPILILISFVYLVTKHHQKLYAPSDFRDDSGFLLTMGSKQQLQRLEEKTKELTTELVQDAKVNMSTQKQNIDTNAPIELNSRNYDIYANLKSKYLMIENLIFSVLESEFNAPLVRSVASNKFYFDGVIELPTEVLAFEVKYTKIGHINKEIVLNKAFRHLDSVKSTFAPKTVRFILVVVHEGKNINKLMNDINDIISTSKNRIEYRLYDLNELLKKLE